MEEYIHKRPKWMEKDFILIRFFFAPLKVSIFFCHSLSAWHTHAICRFHWMSFQNYLNLFLAIAIIIIIISGSSRRRLQFSKFLFAILLGSFLFCFVSGIFFWSENQKKNKITKTKLDHFNIMNTWIHEIHSSIGLN